MSQYLVQDLRARTVQATRSRLPQFTIVVENEWQAVIVRVTEFFGVHPFVAYVYKEYGNCLFEMGRHDECPRAYESAFANLRRDNDNLQLAKVLWLWGSALGRLDSNDDAKEKLYRALEIAQGRDEELAMRINADLSKIGEGKMKRFRPNLIQLDPVCRYGDGCRDRTRGRCAFYHPSGAGDGRDRPACKFGVDCENNRLRMCRFYHPPSHGFGIRGGEEPCEDGENCRKYKIGRCSFYHPPQERQICKFGDDCNNHKMRRCRWYHPSDS